MIGEKAGVAGAKLSCRQSAKRKSATKRVRGGVVGVSGSGDGGSGVGGELDGVADVKFIGVRDSPKIVEIKKYQGGLNFYKTVKEGNLVAAIIHDLARVHADPNYPKRGLNIVKVGLCIEKDAQIVHEPIGKRFLVEFVERNPLKLDDLPDELFPLKLEGLTDPQFVLLKDQIVKQGRQCFLELKKRITGDRERHVQGRQRKDLDTIQPYLAENGVPQDDDRIQASKDQLAEVVAEFAPSNGKLLDAKGEAAKSALITFFKVQLQKLEPAQKQREGPQDLTGIEDGELFMNPYMPQV